MGPFERHPFGWTVALTFGLALLLSLLPLPPALKPFPQLTSKPGQTLALIFVPPDGKPPVQPPPPVLPEPEMNFDELDLNALKEHQLSPADEKEGRRWELLATKVGASHVQVEEPCLESTPDGECRKTALSVFFQALRQPREEAPVRVVVFGTSLIASDHITDVLRRRLEARHGLAGPGFLFVDRPTRGAGRTVRTGDASPGWVIAKVTDDPPATDTGIGGVWFSAPAGEPQYTNYAPPPGARQLELFLVGQPGGGRVQVLADGKLLTEVATQSDARLPITSTFELPQKLRTLSLRTAGGPVRLDAVSLETGGRGVVLDSLGLPGASAGVLLREDEAFFAAQLERRDPKLIVLMMGGNDAFDLSLNRYTPTEARQRFQKLIRRVKAAAPDAACLFASPPDGGTWRMDKTIAIRNETKVVAAFLRELAREEGCGFYDMQLAMGGEGSIERWWKAGLMNEDLIHPISMGGDLLGYLMGEALERARSRHDDSVARASPRRSQIRRVAPAAPVRRVADRGAGTPARAGPVVQVVRSGVRVRACRVDDSGMNHSGASGRAIGAGDRVVRAIGVNHPGAPARAIGAGDRGAQAARAIGIIHSGAPRAIGAGDGRAQPARAIGAPRRGRDGGAIRGSDGGPVRRGGGISSDGGIADRPRLRSDDGGARERPDAGAPEAAAPIRRLRDGGSPRLEDGGVARSRRDAGARVEDAEALSAALADGGLALFTPSPPAPICFPSANASCEPSPAEASSRRNALEGVNYLEPFFRRLAALESADAGRVAIAQLGASHTAAQFFSDEMRAVLTARFGYAGRGFVAAGRASNRLENAGAWRETSEGWKVFDAMKHPEPNATWGLTGVRVVGKPGAELSVGFDESDVGPAEQSKLQVFWLHAPDAGTLEVSLDGKSEARLEPLPPGSPPLVRVLEMGGPGGGHQVQLTNVGDAPVAVFGVSHELSRPGLVYDALGLPGSTVMTLAAYGQVPLGIQLEARQPDLFILFYGTNEAALDPDGVVEKMRASYPVILATLHRAAPEAACLFLGPTDRMRRKKKGGGWRPAEAISIVDAALRGLAATHRCAYWGTREVMGGEGSIDRWRRTVPPLAHKDHVHLTEEGYQRLAGWMSDDLLGAYDEWRRAQ